MIDPLEPVECPSHEPFQLGEIHPILAWKQTIPQFETLPLSEGGTLRVEVMELVDEPRELNRELHPKSLLGTLLKLFRQLVQGMSPLWTQDRLEVKLECVTIQVEEGVDYFVGFELLSFPF